MNTLTSLKALTLYQPWAQLAALAAKQIETRSWSTEYRDALAIHAGKNTDWLSICKDRPFREALYGVEWNVGHAAYKRYVHHAATRALLFPLGAVIAVCELVACLPIPETPRRFPVTHGKLNVLLPPDPPEKQFGDYRPGRFAWILAKMRMLPEPIPCRGYQQLWDVSPQILSIINAQLEALPSDK